MGVASYFEFVTTLLAWILYSKVWSVLLDTALVFVPFITMIVGNIVSSRRAGDDEGSAAIQSLKKIETDLYMMVGVIVFAAIPVLDVALGEMTYVKPALDCAVPAETIDGTATGTTYDGVLTTLGGETGKAPIWWGALHTLSKAVVSASIAGLPCANDVSSVGYKLAGDKIGPPELRKELGDFTRDCYKASKSRLQRMDTSSLTPEQRNDTLWLGSQYFRTTDGFYNKYYSYDPRASYPFNASRDAGFEDDSGTGGHPTCNEWWSDASNGLRIKTLDSVDPTLLNEMVYGAPNLMDTLLSTTLSTTEKEDAFLRKYLELQEVNLGLAGSSVSTGYRVSNIEAASGLMDTMLGFAADLATAGVAAIGAVIEAPGAVIEGYAIRNGISMIQSLVLMMLVVMLPFLMLFSQYKISTVFTLSIIFFSVHLLSYVWAIAFWVENNMLTAMLDGGGLSVFTPGDNLTQTTLMWFMERFLYVILPMIVLASLGWAGISAGTLGSQIQSFGGKAGAVGGSGVKAVKTVATKGKG